MVIVMVIQVSGLLISLGTLRAIPCLCLWVELLARGEAGRGLQAEESWLS